MRPRLVSIPWISGDIPEHRGNFLYSTAARDVQYLSDAGKLFSMNSEVKNAVLRIFNEIDKPAKDPGPPVHRPVVSMDHLASVMDRFVSVSAVERIVKAVRT